MVTHLLSADINTAMLTEDFKFQTNVDMNMENVKT